MSSLQRITSASWLEQLYDTIEFKQDDLTRQSFKLLQIACPTYFNYSLMCLFFSRFVWYYIMLRISHWFIAPMKETPEENNGYVVFNLNIQADQLGNRVWVMGEALLRPPPPLSSASFWTKRRRRRFFLHVGYLLHESTSLSIFLLQGKEMYLCGW